MRKASPQEREQIWSKMMTHMQELSERRQTKYEKEYKSDAILIREEMLSRIPQETREKMQVFHGSYAMGGFYERTAEDLEMLSRMLSK